MPLSSAQQSIADSDHRFRVAICGRRFGKTFLAIRELARFARQPSKRVWFIAPTRGQAKGIAWEKLKDRLLQLNWVKKINESELSILLVNGSTIELRSADAYDRMRGYRVDFTVFDEFADMDPQVWTVVRPTLADSHGHALFIGTPKGNQNWARGMYDQHLTNPDWQSFTYTTVDGGNVPEEEIEAAKRDMDERTYRQEFLATFEDAGNQVFYAWSREHNLLAYEGAPPRKIVIGMDFNVGRMCACVGVIEGSDLHLFDEIVLTSSNTDEMVAEIRTRYNHIPASNITVYPDPASRQNRSSAGGRTDLSILQNAGFVVKCPNRHSAVRDGINAVNSRLCTASGERHLYVAPTNKYTIESLERLSYRENSNQPDKDSGYDHMADAIRYLVDFIWPVRRAVEPRPNQRWGHKIA
jgi:hypothetical protein